MHDNLSFMFYDSRENLLSGYLLRNYFYEAHQGCHLPGSNYRQIEKGEGFNSVEYCEKGYRQKLPEAKGTASLGRANKHKREMFIYQDETDDRVFDLPTPVI